MTYNETDMGLTISSAAFTNLGDNNNDDNDGDVICHDIGAPGLFSWPNHMRSLVHLMESQETDRKNSKVMAMLRFSRKKTQEKKYTKVK